VPAQPLPSQNVPVTPETSTIFAVASVPEGYGMSPWFFFYGLPVLSPNTALLVSWGDGTYANATISANGTGFPHSYAGPGVYVVGIQANGNPPVTETVVCENNACHI
jgi:hypothetical protein